MMLPVTTSFTFSPKTYKYSCSLWSSDIETGVITDSSTIAEVQSKISSACETGFSGCQYNTANHALFKAETQNSAPVKAKLIPVKLISDDNFNCKLF